MTDNVIKFYAIGKCVKTSSLRYQIQFILKDYGSGNLQGILGRRKYSTTLQQIFNTSPLLAHLVTTAF